jgi:hypothetical protein
MHQLPFQKEKEKKGKGKGKEKAKAKDLLHINCPTEKENRKKKRNFPPAPLTSAH